MELASTGISVDLYDKNDRCLSQASAQNEGKIHLGYVYANDPTLRTARTMVRGAIMFSSLLRRWIGSAVDSIPVSAPFYYVVHRESLLSVAEIESHFRATHALALQESRGVALDYFGGDYRVPPIRVSEVECASLFDRRSVWAAFKTSEISIDSEAMAALVRARLSADPKIQCLLRTHVHGVEQNDTNVSVKFEVSGNRGSERYDHVVNALWDGRLTVDKTAGLEPERPWLYRVKHFLRLHAPGISSTIPPTTIILGPFGDIASYGESELYLSWYPAGMRGLSSDLSPPNWPRVLDESASMAIRQAILKSLVQIVPSVADLTPEAVESCQVKGGIIFA